MSKALIIRSSASGAASVSNALIDRAIAQLRDQDPGLQIVARDLGVAPVPHLDADALAGIHGEPSTEAQAAARTLSQTLIAELQAADLIVIGAPMYNFGIPSTLKAWFDYVLRAGVTFQYTAEGPEGLLKNKRAIVILSRGGLFSEGPYKALDAQEPHLRTLLGFIGIKDVAFVRAEGLAMGETVQRKAIASAQDDLAAAATAIAVAA